MAPSNQAVPSLKQLRSRGALIGALSDVPIVSPSVAAAPINLVEEVSVNGGANLFDTNGSASALA